MIYYLLLKSCEANSGFLGNVDYPIKHHLKILSFKVG